MYVLVCLFPVIFPDLHGLPGPTLQSWTSLPRGRVLGPGPKKRQLEAPQPTQDCPDSRCRSRVAPQCSAPSASGTMGKGNRIHVTPEVPAVVPFTTVTQPKNDGTDTGTYPTLSWPRYLSSSLAHLTSYLTSPQVRGKENLSMTAMRYMTGAQATGGEIFTPGIGSARILVKGPP